MKITILADLYKDGTHDPAVEDMAEALRPAHKNREKKMQKKLGRQT
jgi:hypothetical protein